MPSNLVMPAEMDLSACRVLVIEDNEFERKLLVSMLRRLNVGHLACAGSGTEALTLIDHSPERFDFVLCDLRMHDPVCMDGIEFLRVASRRSVGCLVVLSGLSEDLLSATEILADASGTAWGGVLRKPVTLRALADRMAACLPAAKKPFAPEQAERIAIPAWTQCDVRMAIRRREFLPLFQPQISLSTGALTGVEALARWEHPEAGMISPAAFIPIMERSDMIDELFEIILDGSLRAIAGWGEKGWRIPVSINASPLTLENTKVPNRWRDIVVDRGIDPGLITIEVTETAIARDFRNLLESITRLRMHGFRVSLDDFGTSYSSLQQLSELPANEVKIDRSFVGRAMVALRSLTILESIVDMANALGLSTVAEGIETAEHRAFARDIGCDAGQGWHLGMPVSAAVLISTCSGHLGPAAVQPSETLLYHE